MKSCRALDFLSTTWLRSTIVKVDEVTRERAHGWTRGVSDDHEREPKGPSALAHMASPMCQAGDPARSILEDGN